MLLLPLPYATRTVLAHYYIAFLLRMFSPTMRFPIYLLRVPTRYRLPVLYPPTYLLPALIVAICCFAISYLPDSPLLLLPHCSGLLPTHLSLPPYLPLDAGSAGCSPTRSCQPACHHAVLLPTFLWYAPVCTPYPVLVRLRAYSARNRRASCFTSAKQSYFNARHRYSCRQAFFPVCPLWRGGDALFTVNTTAHYYRRWLWRAGTWWRTAQQRAIPPLHRVTY